MFALLSGLLLLALHAIPLLADEPDQQVLVHYMPWYAADADSKNWGWHWTMDHFDPEKIDSKSKREIASHYYPQIGPYDSGDPHVLEYHVLLMKFAGFDGVVIDWYGTRDFRDYSMIDRNTQALIPWLKKAGLKFTFCYEDQTVKHLIEANKITASDGVTETVSEIDSLAKSFFADDSWLKIAGKPVLLVFGPQHFEPKEWQLVFKQLKSPPLVFGLPHLTDTFGLDGSFSWPPVNGGETVSADQWKKRLVAMAGTRTGNSVIASAFPGFHDIYSQAKLHDSYGFIDDRNGVTFKESLAIAKKSDATLIQIATWNDFGEGTIIEPTREFGFRYLEHFIDQDTKAAFTKADLALPILLFERRKSGCDSADQISAALFNGDCKLARELLNKRK